MRSSQHRIFTPQRCSWMLYDWASSVLPTLHTTFVFAVYFTTAVLPENGTFYWAMMTGIAALATGLLAPILGHLADLKGQIKKGSEVFAQGSKELENKIAKVYEWAYDRALDGIQREMRIKRDNSS